MIEMKDSHVGTGLVPQARAGRKTCIIVDAYSGASRLAPIIAEKGYDLVHVQSSARRFLGGHFFRPDDFIENIVFEGDPFAVLGALARYEVVAVIPGVHTGVVLADWLSEALGVPSNGTAQSLDRVDKFGMYRVLSANGLRHARSFSSSDVEELVAWFRSSGASKVVVKPCSSAGTDLVKVCRSEAEVRDTFDRLIHKENKIGIVNHAAVIQEFLEGSEHIVDTISYKGRHRVTDVWRYRMIAINGVSFVYEKVDLLDPTYEHFQALQDYVFKVLDAFGVKEGASHNEVMLTPDGPALIEINPRLAGAHIPRLTAIAVGEGQLEWTAKVYLDRADPPPCFDQPYTLRKHAMLCPLISSVEGQFAGFEFKDELEALPSFQFADYHIKVGGPIARTIDIYTQPGLVFLAHEDPAVLDADYRRIRQLEREGMYRVAS
jgi:biotin carboxylase